jgi:hypothetical protein
MPTQPVPPIFLMAATTGPLWVRYAPNRGAVSGRDHHGPGDLPYRSFLSRSVRRRTSRTRRTHTTRSPTLLLRLYPHMS